MTIAFIGNVSTVIPLVIGFDKFKLWYEKRQEKKGKTRSKRSERARNVWNKYGLPGLALAGPILTGIHIAAFIAMSLGARRNRALVWMTASLFLWTVVFGVVTMLGFDWFVRA